MDTAKELSQHISQVTATSDGRYPFHIQTPLDRLTLQHEVHRLRGAGFPSYSEGIFARDEIITSELLEDSTGLREILTFAARIQGTKKDPVTGEEHGSIFHEFNVTNGGGVTLEGREGLSTLYNASDAIAHFLRGHEQYIQMTGDRSLFERQRDKVIYAADNTLRHLDTNGLYVVDPTHAGAKNYALKVTSWRDSELKNRDNGEPVYPVVYPLVHIQNMAGLRSAARLLHSSQLGQEAEKMSQAIPYLFDKDIEGLSLAIDGEGRVSGVSTDILHALHYLDPNDIEPKILERFLVNTTSLETPFGYRALSAEDALGVNDPYHAKTVWTHEQAIIHKGARRHREWAQRHGHEGLVNVLQRVEEVSGRVYFNYLKDNLDSNPELFLIHEDGGITPGGNDPQAWAVGARYYFEKTFADERIGQAA